MLYASVGFSSLRVVVSGVVGWSREGTYYNVDVEGLSVAGQRLNLATSMFNEGYGSVLDSGTTFTYLPSPAFRAVKQAVSHAWGAPWRLFLTLLILVIDS